MTSQQASRPIRITEPAIRSSYHFDQETIKLPWPAGCTIMRIEQLDYIAAVARLGSFRKAAEALHISQPALSESVRSLERELGVDLLERGRHGARLSESGRDLLPHMRTVLDAVDGLRLAADEQHQTSRVVRIGTVHTATVPLLAPSIRLFRAAYPATQVEVICGLQA